MKLIITPVLLLTISLFFVYSTTYLITSDEKIPPLNPAKTVSEPVHPLQQSHVVKADDGYGSGIASRSLNNQEPVNNGSQSVMRAIKGDATIGNSTLEGPVLTQNRAVIESGQPHHGVVTHDNPNLDSSIFHSQPPDYPGPIVIGTPGVD